MTQPNETVAATELHPGREMDEAVALRVMGWTRGRVDLGYYPWVDGEDRRQLSVYRFSRELSHAMMVVEHKRRDGWVFSLQALPPDPANASDMLWECVFQRPEVDGGFQEGHGATAPEAIARAALAEIER